MKKVKYFSLMILCGLVLGLAAAGCNDNSTTEPLPVNELAPPTNVQVVIDALNTGGSSFATVTWTASTDESNSDFDGYVIITDSVSSSGTRRGTFDSAFVAKSQSDMHNVSSIRRGTLYRTSVYARNNNNGKSQSVTTIIYSGVYTGSGEIDEFSSSSTTQSGFGWDAQTGLGTQYSFTSSNAAVIDLHMREASGNLTFYSPNAVPSNPITSARSTMFALIGTGEDAYNKPLAQYSDLTEPSATSISVDADNVYLLKTQDGNYAKVWVKSISGTTYKTAAFDYKIQPVINLKALKR